jgi:GAF domain-containing protein
MTRPQLVTRVRFPLEGITDIWGRLSGGKPVLVANIEDSPPLTQAYQALGAQLGVDFGYIRSWMGVPLLIKERLIGVLVLSSHQPDYFTRHHAMLALVVANQAVVAIENARLYEQAQELTRKTVTLAQFASKVAFASSFDTTFAALARSVVETTTAVACSVVLIDEVSNTMRLAKAYGLPKGYLAAMEASWRAGAQSPTIQAFRLQQTSLVHHRRNAILSNPLYAALHPFMSEVDWDTVMIVPMIYNGQALGTLNVYFLPETLPSETERTFLSIIADQAAVAVENTRLIAEVQDKATLEERQRLARDLHDAVTQMLFSDSLPAEVLPRLWERDPEAAWQSLQDLRLLTRGALAEMRTLLLELRPIALREAALGALLRQLAEAVTGRTRLPITLRLDGEHDRSRPTCSLQSTATRGRWCERSRDPCLFPLTSNKRYAVSTA